ncbi:MAG: GNAT family N-acetyltransferase, partial [Bacillota bacterium]
LIRSEALGYQPGWITHAAGRELASPRYQYFIARVDGEPAACGALVDVGSPARLEYVATRPAFQGRGLALALVQTIQRAAIGPLFLLYTREVAGRLYQRAGFVSAGEVLETECWAQ